jgi:hypothetical protein
MGKKKKKESFINLIISIVIAVATLITALAELIKAFK